MLHFFVLFPFFFAVISRQFCGGFSSVACSFRVHCEKFVCAFRIFLFFFNLLYFLLPLQTSKKRKAFLDADEDDDFDDDDSGSDFDDDEDPDQIEVPGKLAVNTHTHTWKTLNLPQVVASFCQTRLTFCLRLV